MMRTLRAVSVAFCSLAVSVLALEAKIAVQRGRTADLSTAIAGNTPRRCSRIRYVGEPGLSCGSVQPKQFDCSYNGRVLYQHYGCYSTHEVVSFQLSILPDNFNISHINENVEVKFFSVEIVVEDSQSLLSNLTLRTSSYNDGVLFRVEFLQEIVGRCHYQLVTANHLLPLPLAGELRGSFPRTLPCGYTSRDPLHYVPNRERRAPRDYVLLRVSNSEEEVYVLLEVWSNGAPLLPHVPVEGLAVHGATYTPIPDGLFPFQDGELRYRYTVPAHSGGQFVYLLSSNEKVSRTVFTSADLRAGLVSYHRGESLTTNTSTIPYSVADLAGATLLQGEISLLSIPRSWSLSQRTNRGLALARGGAAAIDPARLDFYTLGACVDHSTVTLIQPPRHGDFTFLNGMGISNTTVALNALKNGTVVYTHSGDVALADSSVWKFFCPLGLELVLSFGIMIAPLGSIPPQWSPRHTITTYWNLAVPISYLPLYDPDSLHKDILIRVVGDLAGSLVRVEDSGSVYAARTPFPPFLDADQVNASAVLQFTLADVDSRSIWYLPPENDSVDTLHLTAWDSDLPPYLMNDVWVPVAIADGPLESSILLSTKEEFPPLLRNAPLPLHTLLPMFITARALYSRVPETPTSGIVYVVRTDPTHGVLCLVTPAGCSSSLTQFTQSDINRQRVIYQPAENTMVLDKFEFAVTLHGISHYNQSYHHFHISPVDKPRDFSSGKQFWINKGGEKPVALKYLRPYSNLLGRTTEFIVVTYPRHGVLLLDSTPHPVNFSFYDLFSRRLSYRHSDMHDSHCSDSIAFTASNGTHSLQGSLQIAIAQDPGGLLYTKSGSQQLLGHTSFVFRPSHLPVYSSFCVQFVHYAIWTPPNRGVLQLYNTEYDTVVQLRENSTFTAEDVMVGRLHYSLASATPVTHNISDVFYFNVSDPMNNKFIPPRTVPVQAPNFQILIEPSPDVVHRISSINISSPKPLTWLLDYSAYGYVFGPSDINIDSMTLLPSEIVIVIERQPMFGTILRNTSQVSSFSLEEVNAGWVRYETTLNRFDLLSQDTFRLSIVVNLSNISYAQYVVQRHNFTVEWCSITILQPSYTVAEREGSVQVVLRREGPTWFQSNVTLSTVPLTASPSTSPLLTDGDYFLAPQEVTFGPGERVVTIHIPITDDQVAEDTENFTLALSSPISAVLREGHGTATIWITDLSDYATVGFVGPPALTDPTTCQLEVRVGEGVGSVALTVTRTGNLEESVGVICYTRPGTASRGQDFHPRPNNAPSRVEFQPNETTAQCRVNIVDDTLHETTERFLVILGAVRGRASVNTSTSPLCVYLQFDRNDMPEVSFNTSELTIQESKVSEVLAHFKIVRAGLDLSSRTTVYYTSLNRPPHDRATLHEDFELFARGECGDGVGCVNFAQGQTEVELSVRIMPDNLQEGNESFHLTFSDLTNGRRGRYELLRITILDATEPTIVEFSEPMYWLRESERLTSVAITRRGFTSSVTNVTCIRKPGNATSESQITSHNRADFIAGNGPSVVTFWENQTSALCTLWLLDDDVYEGPEDLTLRLNTNSTWVVLTRARARVIITDEEDAPLVQFSPARYTVTEPLSNFPRDHTFLTLYLTRSGDTSHTSSIVRYSTVEDTALAGVDFVVNTSRLTFLPGENTSQLTVQVLANHDRDADSTLLVALMAVDPNTIISSTGGHARVEVHNRPVTGVYFPDLPVVVSLLEDGSYRGSMDPNLPLACIASCDEEYLGITGVQYREECLRQHIDSDLTVYTWELSHDGFQFHQVTRGTAFTDTQVKVLEPVYLAPGLFVRCSTQAVDTSGTKGYSRASLPAKLSQPPVVCVERSWEATMFSYPSFSGAPEDLVQLKVTLPSTPNTLPLLSTQPFTTHPLSLLTHPPSRVLHLCSNLPSPTLTSPALLHLPSPLPHGAREEKSLRLYVHLNSSSCLWHFHTWLPLHKLQADCGAVSTGSQVSVTVFAVHVHIQVNGTLVASELNATTAVLPFTPSPTPLVTTFDIFPLNTNHTNAFIFPVSVSASGDTLEVYFYSVVMFPGRFLPPSSNTSLLYSSTGGGTQAWLARLDYSLNLSLQLYCAPDSQQFQGCAPNELYTFPLHLLHPSLVPTITTHTSLLHSINSTTEQTGPFQYGETVYGVVAVDPSYRLRPNHSLAVFQVLLCHSTTQPLSCADQPSGLTVLNGPGGGGVFQARSIQLGSPNRTAFQFRPTMSLLPEYSNSSWYIHIIYGLQSDRTYPLHTVLPLPLVLPQPTPSPSLLGHAPLTTGSVYLYAAIAILATAIVLVGVTCVVVALMLWGWRVKQKKVFLQRQRRGERDSKKEPLNSESSEKSNRNPPRSLQRTHSTIGFPTVERHKRDSPYRRPPTSGTCRPPTPPSTSHHTPRSKSLPNLAFHPICLDGFAEPQQRRHQHKPQTKVKMLNTEHSSLNSWSHTLQARAQGDLGTAAVRVINELAAAKKSYGVNDLRGGLQREGRGNEAGKASALAYYAVHSLAASANTPEPGSLPATEL